MGAAQQLKSVISMLQDLGADDNNNSVFVNIKKSSTVPESEPVGVVLHGGDGDYFVERQGSETLSDMLDRISRECFGQGPQRNVYTFHVAYDTSVVDSRQSIDCRFSNAGISSY